MVTAKSPVKGSDRFMPRSMVGNLVLKRRAWDLCLAVLLGACSRHPYFLSVLRGSGGTTTIVEDPLRHTLEVVESDSVEDGKDVHLTLDHTIPIGSFLTMRDRPS